MMMQKAVARCLVALAACLFFVGCSQQSGPGPQTVEGMQPVGTVDMRQIQAAYIGSASGGDGTLFFQGQSYPFKIGGVGIGGIGASTIEAAGDVYALKSVRDFGGAYAQGRYGFAIGNTSGGDLWMKNEHGVILHMRAKRTGLMLTLGGDAMIVSMDR